MRSNAVGDTSRKGEDSNRGSVAILGVVLMALMIAVVGVAVFSLTSIRRDYVAFAEEDFPGFNNLIHVDRDLLRAQRSLEIASLTNDVEERSDAIAEYRSQLDRTAARWSSYLMVARPNDTELRLQGDYGEYRTGWIAATSTLAELLADGRDSTDPQLRQALVEAQTNFSPLRDVVHLMEEVFYEPSVENGTDAGQFDVRLVLLGLLVGALALGAVVSVTVARRTINQQLRDRDLDEAKRVAELNRRFRSLMESTQDVITLVSEVDTLTVMSPSLGALGRLSRTVDPTTVAELLGSDPFVVWSEADQRLAEGSRATTVEIEMTGADGSTLYLEATGARMVDNPEERVWAWRDITPRKRLESQLVHRAFHDPLTGAANRELLIDRAEHALHRSDRSLAPVSLLFCDLDDFKSVNDSMGHSVGDELLEVVTQRLRSCIRKSDTLARFGGDEFAILLEGIDSEAATALAERIVTVVSAETELAGRPVFQSLCIGVATSAPGGTAAELFSNADTAMYGAKHLGEGRVETFQQEVGEVLRFRRGEWDATRRPSQ